MSAAYEYKVQCRVSKKMVIDAQELVQSPPNLDVRNNENCTNESSNNLDSSVKVLEYKVNVICNVGSSCNIMQGAILLARKFVYVYIILLNRNTLIIFLGSPVDMQFEGNMFNCPMASTRCFNILLRDCKHIPIR